MAYDHNPYGGHEAVVEQVPPAKGPDEVPDGSTKEILAWVDGDADRAALALEAERSRDEPRKSLVEKLEKASKG